MSAPARKWSKGGRLSAALHQEAYELDKAFVQAVTLGEETSEVSLILQNLSELYFEENKDKITVFLSLLEPFLMLFVGGHHRIYRHRYALADFLDEYRLETLFSRCFTAKTKARSVEYLHTIPPKDFYAVTVDSGRFSAHVDGCRAVCPVDSTGTAEKKFRDMLPKECATLPPMLVVLPPPMQADMRQCKNAFHLPKDEATVKALSS